MTSPTEIHKACCKRCPTNQNKVNGTVDPESTEIKTYPKDLIVKEFLFVCAWRPDKLCKGLCDYFEIDEKFIADVYNVDSEKIAHQNSGL